MSGIPPAPLLRTFGPSEVRPVLAGLRNLGSKPALLVDKLIDAQVRFMDDAASSAAQEASKAAEGLVPFLKVLTREERLRCEKDLQARWFAANFNFSEESNAVLKSIKYSAVSKMKIPPTEFEQLLRESRTVQLISTPFIEDMGMKLKNAGEFQSGLAKFTSRIPLDDEIFTELANRIILDPDHLYQLLQSRLYRPTKYQGYIDWLSGKMLEKYASQSEILKGVMRDAMVNCTGSIFAVNKDWEFIIKEGGMYILTPKGWKETIDWAGVFVNKKTKHAFFGATAQFKAEEFLTAFEQILVDIFNETEKLKEHSLPPFLRIIARDRKLKVSDKIFILDPPPGDFPATRIALHAHDTKIPKEQSDLLKKAQVQVKDIREDIYIGEVKAVADAFAQGLLLAYFKLFNKKFTKWW